MSEELYTKTTHFVLEFIQNADDNSYASGITPALEIRLDVTNRIIEIRCNEVGFTLGNVQAICSVGESTKRNQEGYIGALFYYSVAGRLLHLHPAGEKGIGNS